MTELVFNAKECEDCDGSYGTFECAGQDGTGIKVVFGSEVTRIPSWLFYPRREDINEYANVVSVEFKGNKVTEIGVSAFRCCKNLDGIEMPEGVKVIGGAAFADCAGMEKVVIPSTVKSIGTDAFTNTISLTELVFNAKECEDCDGSYGTFECAGQDGTGIKVVFGSEVTRIPSWLFYPRREDINEYANVVSVEFKGNKVTEIGVSAFCCCKNLTEMIIPDSVTTINSYSFNGCFSLTSVVFEEPFTWYLGGKEIIELYDPQTAATALVNTYVDKALTKK